MVTALSLLDPAAPLGKLNGNQALIGLIDDWVPRTCGLGTGEPASHRAVLKHTGFVEHSGAAECVTCKTSMCASSSNTLWYEPAAR